MEMMMMKKNENKQQLVLSKVVNDKRLEVIAVFQVPIISDIESLSDMLETLHSFTNQIHDELFGAMYELIGKKGDDNAKRQ